VIDIIGRLDSGESPGSIVLAMAEALAGFSEERTGLTCSYLTAAHLATARQIRQWLQAAGFETHVDAVGNVVGLLPGIGAVRGTLLSGSHYDRVVNAGKFDGRLGIFVPILAAARLHRAGVRLPFDLRVIAFAEEEGVRFKSTFLGSRAITGQFDEAVLDRSDDSGVTLRAALAAAGLDGAAISSAALDSDALLGFVEVHIEQGPVLLDENLAVGVVTAIAGSIRSTVRVTGMAGHSGTVPMGRRQDAAAAAAEIVLAVESRCSTVPGLVGTVGQLRVPDGAMNVIPGRCDLSVDVRAPTDDVRDAAMADIVAASRNIAARRGVTVDWTRVLRIDSVQCAPEIRTRLAESICRVSGISTARQLPSGAGHDAMVMANITPMGMLFVRCGNGGVSHHPAETMSQEDADVAVRVFEDFLLNLPERHGVAKCLDDLGVHIQRVRGFVAQ
jgi:beta-ureidopropionase / N-carbamoyl-L-amino-acid hydrolase